MEFMKISTNILYQATQFKSTVALFEKKRSTCGFASKDLAKPSM